MTPLDEHAIKTAVRERYARAATAGASCCGPTETLAAATTDAAHLASSLPASSLPASSRSAASCCTPQVPSAFSDGRPLPADLASASLGCGAPLEAAALRAGETVVDLGSGAGLDVFLAADRVGPSGRAIGVDMTPEMVERARATAARLGMANAEFRLGEIEHLPVADASADVVISNCVINLLPDKRPAFGEAFRVLRPGGRLVVSDIVSAAPLPDAFKTPETWTACLGGAIPEEDYLRAMREAGFADVAVVARRPAGIEGLSSVTVRAVKPGA